MLSGSSPSGLPCMSNHTALNLSAHEVVLGCKGRVPNDSDNSSGKQAGRYRGMQVQSTTLANFSSSGREEGGKKISPQPRTAVQQTRKNEFPSGKQQNFPKATFARSSRPPPFHPHLICSAIQRSAGILLRRNPRSGRRERSLRSSDCCKPVP